MKIPNGMLLFAALYLLASSSASADELVWSAVQWVGTQRDCSEKYMNVRWRIFETQSRITLQADSKSSQTGWQLSAHQLNPDGSGRINTSYHNGRPAWFEFAAGHGPRVIYFNFNYQACIWQLHPV
jgi:hypothetical protein